MTTALIIVLVMGMVGLFFGFVLAYANKKFSIEMNPLIHIVEDILPKGQCGACGFPGCLAYAEAVVLDSAVQPNLCIPGKAKVAEEVAKLTGKVAAKIDPIVAHVKCANPISVAQKKYQYHGINDCVAASILHLGPKDCQYGCIGFGTCEKNCPFDAIKLNDKGLPVVDREACTGCGKCASVCPKKIIAMVSPEAHVGVDCSSHDKGAVSRKLCPVSCIGCGICAKQCQYGAIVVQDNLAVVDHAICLEKCSESTCLPKCPTGAIQDRLKK